MTRRLRFTLTISYWFLVLTILGLTYPLTDYRQRLMTAGQTAMIYFEMTSIIWALGMLVWWSVTKMLGSRSVLAGGAAFVLLAVGLCAYGIFEFRAPTAIRSLVTPELMGAHFFRDYMPLVFSWISGPLCALALAVIVVINVRSKVSTYHLG